MKIAIAGAGTTGAYAYRLLKSQGLEADVFHRDCRTACGINPCAWGTSRDFFELVDAAGLHPEKYILQTTDHVWMENERRVIDRLLSKGTLKIKDAWVLKKNSRRMGMQVGLKEAVALLRALSVR